MHMYDALLSPAVGGTMWTVTAGTIAYCSRQLRRQGDNRKAPLMGVLAAFIFAAQMINFTIPATGSSGHLGGGLLLAIFLGPHAALLAIASVLVVQALFFADGGLLALGCNIFNLGIIPAFVAYPFIFRKLVDREPSRGRLIAASLGAAVVGLQLGAFAVVLETTASGLTMLPFGTFLLLMQPIHFGIGLVEGLATAAVVAFVWQARPDILQSAWEARPIAVPMRSLLTFLLAAALITGGMVSWWASEHPDGLEWSIAQVTGNGEVPEPGYRLHGLLAELQDKLSVLPDYAFRAAGATEDTVPADGSRVATSVAGLAGGLASLALCAGLGLLLRKRARKG